MVWAKQGIKKYGHFTSLINRKHHDIPWDGKKTSMNNYVKLSLKISMRGSRYLLMKLEDRGREFIHNYYCSNVAALKKKKLSYYHHQSLHKTHLTNIRLFQSLQSWNNKMWTCSTEKNVSLLMTDLLFENKMNSSTPA